MKLILAALFFLLISGAWVSAQDLPPIEEINVNASAADIQHFLDSTVQIFVHGNPNRKSALSGNALGSLMLADKNQVLVVTHNHWGPFLEEDAEIEFLAADHRSLAVITARQFWAAVRYQDDGTIILDAPDGVAQFFLENTPESQMNQPKTSLKPGMMVQTVHYIDRKVWTLDVQTLVVTEVHDGANPPSVILRSLNGSPVLDGDSGGGIWYNGALAGIIWSNILVTQDSPNATPIKAYETEEWYYSDTSCAAILTWSINDERIVR